MKKVALILLSMIFIFSCTVFVFADSNAIEFNSDDSTVEVHNASTGYSSYKVIVQKGNQKYYYDIFSDVEVFPLSMGNGTYKVTILGSNDGRRYRRLFSRSFYAKLEENRVFLSSSQTVNFNEESEVVKVAKEITKDAKTDLEKFEIIHEYVTTHMTYDFRKARTVKPGYIPNPDKILKAEKGICYDFAAVTASMLRSVNVPTKLIKGYSVYTTAYHAWNEVLLDGEWKVVDTSTDSFYVMYNMDFSNTKDSEDYEVKKIY